MKFKSDIEVQAGLKDSSGAIGSSGQVLSSTGSNVSWVNQTTVANDVQNRVKAGVAINKGQAVYVTGADGTNIIVGLASNATEATSSKTLGLLNATVATNGFADVVQIGRLSGLNTLGATAGDPVWLGTGGNLIYGLLNKPYAPAHLVFIGVVTRVNVSNGEIFINVQNGFELKEIHDVDIITNVPINGDILGYDGTLWVNKTIAEWLGFTPANASGTTNYVSKFTGTTTLGNSQIFDNGTNVGIGTISPSAKLDVIAESRVSYSTGSQYRMRFTNTDGNGRILVDGDDSALIFGTTVAGGSTATERMRIDSDGFVGIGTTMPSYPLEVNGAIVSKGGGIGGLDGTIGLGDIGTSLSGNSLMGEMYFKTGGTEKMRINISGNVGIGTTSPSEVLSVVSSGASVISAYRNSGNSSYKIQNSGISGYFGLNLSNNIAFGFSADQTDAPFQIKSNGNVGIGTTSPVTSLEVGNGTGLRQIYINGGGYDLALGASGGTAFGFTSTNASMVFNTSAKPLVIGTLSAQPLVLGSNDTERMRITDTGNVGIGTTAFNLSTTGRQMLSLSGANSSLIELQVSGTNQAYIYSGNVGNLEIYGYQKIDLATNGGTRMSITSTGDVFIGATSATNVEKLGVTFNSQDRLGLVLNDTYTGGATSQIAIQFRRNGSAIGSVTTTTSTTSYNITSDYRLKEDFKNYSGLDLISQIKTYDYKWKKSENRMFGVIAHELQDIIPYAVTGEKDAKEMQQVDYSKLVPILVQAIQDQQKQIEELKKLINK
jgi:hypothetical protein